MTTDPPNAYQIRAMRSFQDQVLPGTWKLVLNENDLDELYDLTNDPFEIVNLFGDPSYQSEHDIMKSNLMFWMQAHGDPAFSIFDTGARTNPNGRRRGRSR